MTDESDGLEAASEADGPTDDLAAALESGPDPNREPAPAIESRFLYVDVAAQRAKQLRRGALPRLQELAPDAETGERPAPRNKLERIAMREVDGGKIYYEVPDQRPAEDAS